MDLQTYCTAERGRVAALARSLVVPPALVSQWSTGARPIPWDRCYPIEEATGGAVRRWDLRPKDWHRHWPELIGTADAPDVPEPTTQPGALDEAAA